MLRKHLFHTPQQVPAAQFFYPVWQSAPKSVSLHRKYEGRGRPGRNPGGFVSAPGPHRLRFKKNKNNLRASGTVMC